MSQKLTNADPIKVERYLKIVEWARKRYTKNDNLVLSVGGRPSRYSMIENLAAVKLCGFNNRFPKYQSIEAI